ncbi:alpha/beta hydrolase-fold protein [Actinokineospora auranticolor]|uniref:Acyl-CoA:diacylglycerol acyltransferase n=1 Tax=Actinokineospora auranticolor TaxID=155976 RepID=A0A2S6GQE0_9PSEU|nr:alpha/beta hydrolase-fold protein [Actinokineospora auranticolor]PPK67429.1 S-formylglutathione hydrolase FrmB [Actinokineospora auranticolor]
MSGRMSRRQVIGLAVGGTATTVGLGIFGAWALRQDKTPLSDVRTPIPGPTDPPTTKPPAPLFESRKVFSKARGREVSLLVYRPDGLADDGGTLPTCLALHGRGANANQFTDLGVGDNLSAAAAYAVVAVDGGDATYWVRTDPGDDPQAMLTDELPAWLAELGVSTKPFAVLGVSMGGYGALNYVRAHTGQVRAAAVLSPALFPTWAQAKARDVFPGRALWEQTEPLLHVAELGKTALGVWCGTADPLLPSANQLIDTAKPAVARTGDGGHDADYWRRALPEAMSFIGSHI